MADLTHAQVYDAIRAAVLRVSSLRADRVVLGNRETPWSVADRAFRIDAGEWEDLGWYRRDRLRIAETVTLHLLHRVASDQRRSEDLSGRDAQTVMAGLVQDTTLAATGIRVEPGGPTTREQAGDVIETDVVLRVEYDLLLAEAA